jgi:hypothetical protein
MRIRAAITLLAGMAIAVVAPLLGLLAAGQSVDGYLAFPPRTQAVAHAPFEWGAFLLLSIPALGALGLYLVALLRAAKQPSAYRTGAFPWWGWLGLALIATGWILAWTEGLVPPGWRRQTFTPLWLGYTLTMNALALRATGHSPLTHRPAWFLALFPASAAFWWLFEYLNQFVHSWYYTGTHARSDWDYFMQATLPFSTVLPAIASTLAWLRQFPRIEALALPPIGVNRVLAWLALATGIAVLAAMGVSPERFFAALWMGPPLVLCGLQQIILGETLLAPLARGDWRPLLQPAVAALVCGLFWEMWNYGALAQWHYSIPYAQRFQIFEMPLLGYAGYVPVGVMCALVLDLVAWIVERRGLYFRELRAR